VAATTERSPPGPGPATHVGRDNKYGSLARGRTVVLLLLSSSLCLRSRLTSLTGRKKLFDQRQFKRPAFVEVEMNESFKNHRCTGGDPLLRKDSLGNRLGQLWRDLQDEPHWKYEQLSPVQLLEKLELHGHLRDDHELARANWFWSRQPRLLHAASRLIWFIVALGLPLWLFIVPAIGVPLIIAAVLIVDTDIVRSAGWRRQYELSVDRLIRTSTNDRDTFGIDVFA